MILWLSACWGGRAGPSKRKTSSPERADPSPPQQRLRAGVGGAWRRPCHCCYGVTLLRNTKLRQAGAVRTWGLCPQMPACVLGSAGMLDGLSFPSEHPACIPPKWSCPSPLLPQEARGGDWLQCRAGDIPVWHCECSTVGRLMLPRPPGAGLSPRRTCRGAGDMQRAGAGGCSGAVGAKEIPARCPR